MEDKNLIKIWQKENEYGAKKYVKTLLEHKLVCHLWNKYLLNKIDHTEVAVLESWYFQWCILNANKTDVSYFANVIC